MIINIIATLIIMIITILIILIMTLIITSFVMGKVADIRSRSLWDPGSRIPLSLDYQTPFCRGSFSIVWAFVLVSLFSRQSLEWKHKRINCFIVITVRFGVKYIKINLLYSHYLSSEAIGSFENCLIWNCGWHLFMSRDHFLGNATAIWLIAGADFNWKT